uniref:Alpha-ketoglutarate-dependent dioxygenase AlkB-like domain-containing protein n=1 Tax=Fagus sylvatica TaxID=28930 RepID=A0A2N9HJJ3_FAGSY
MLLHHHLRSPPTVPYISRQISLRFSSLRNMNSSPSTDSSSIPCHPADESILPTQFGKKRICGGRDRLGRSNSKDVDGMGFADCSKGLPEDESILPSRFGKKRKASRGKRVQLGRSNSKHVGGTGVKMKPFDLCLSGGRSSAVFTGSLNEKNCEKWNEMGDIVEGTEQRVLRPGMVLLKRYITLGEQVEIVKKCRELGLGQGGFYQPGYQDGAKLRLQMMCLGLNWDPETRNYEEQRTIDGSKAPSIPHEFSLLVKRAIQDAHALVKKEYKVSNVEDMLPSMSPNDRDESKESLRKGLPVVSLSVGDSAEFLYGDQRNVDEADRVVLESGDVLIFGGNSRHIFHGVSTIIPKSAPQALLEETSICPGRVNLTFRQY